MRARTALHHTVTQTFSVRGSGICNNLTAFVSALSDRTKILLFSTFKSWPKDKVSNGQTSFKKTMLLDAAKRTAA